MTIAAGGVRWTGLSSASVVASDVTKTLVLAHYLSPKDYGLMGLANVVVGFAQMYADLGVSAAIIHKQHSTREQLSSLYWLNIAFGMLIFVCIFGCAPIVSLLFAEPRLTPLVASIAVVFLIAPAGSQFEVLLQRDLRFCELARWEITASVAGTAAAIGSAIAGFGVWALVTGLLANATVKALLLAGTGFAHFRPALHFSRADLKGYLGFGFFQMGERSVNYLAEKCDQIIIGRLLGAEALGFYNFALYLTTQPVSRINPILTRVAFPLFAKVQHSPEHLRGGYLRVLRILTTINAPLLIGLATVAPWAVPALFGAKWAPSVPIVQILCFVGFLRSAANPVGSLQLAKGRARLGFLWNVLLFACTIPATSIGALLGGATGVAVSLLAVQVALLIPAYTILIKPLIGACASEYSLALARPFLLAALMGLAIVALPRLALAAQICFGALTYLLLLPVLHRDAIADFRSTLFSR